MAIRDPNLGLSGVEQTRARIKDLDNARRAKQAVDDALAELNGTTTSSGEKPPLQSAPQNYPDVKPRPNKISNILPKINKLSLSSHYVVKFGGFSTPLQEYLKERGVSLSFIAEDAGLLCSSAFIPGSSHATSDVTGNVATGVVEKIAHTRIFAPIDLEFYVDRDYNMMKFMEHWIEFVSGGSHGIGLAQQVHQGYHFRMHYPDQYKVDQTKIIKFERDYRNELVYNFYGLFPLDMSSIPVSYDNSQIFKVRVTFNYERYVSGYADSVSEIQGTSNNRTGEQTTQTTNSGQQPPIQPQPQSGPITLPVEEYSGPRPTSPVDPNAPIRSQPLF